MLFLTVSSHSDIPPGYEDTYWAMGYVYDQEGYPESGVEVKFEVKVYSEGGGQSYYNHVHGNTNSSGYFSLHIDIPPSGYPILGYMLATISDDGYETIQASGNYSQIGSSIYPAFWVNCIDKDGNGIKDAWELPLAEKFCPTFKLHHPTEWIAPEPVEIVIQKMYMRKFNIRGRLINDEFYCNTDNFNYSNWTESPLKSGGKFYIPHFEYAGLNGNGPNSWISTYQ
ncbi:MAG: hypothetical protein R6V04_07245, partial [bacterium]